MVTFFSDNRRYLKSGRGNAGNNGQKLTLPRPEDNNYWRRVFRNSRISGRASSSILIWLTTSWFIPAGACVVCPGTYSSSTGISSSAQAKLRTAEANDLLGNKKAKSKDIQAFLDQAGDNLDNDTRIKLNSAYRDLAKKEADKADTDAMHAYSEELGFGKWDNLSDRMKETVKRMWKTKKGKK